MRRLMAAGALMLATAAGAAPPSLDRFGGNWSGTGKFQGAPSTVTARFAPLYGGEFWTLDVKVAFADKAGKPMIFEGRATYPIAANGFRAGDWIDSMGNAYAIEPKLDGEALVVTWGNGKSEYRIEADGDLRIEDSMRAADGQWRRFAEAEMKRR